MRQLTTLTFAFAASFAAGSAADVEMILQVFAAPTVAEGSTAILTLSTDAPPTGTGPRL